MNGSTIKDQEENHQDHGKETPPTRPTRVDGARQRGALWQKAVGNPQHAGNHQQDERRNQRKTPEQLLIGNGAGQGPLARFVGPQYGEEGFLEFPRCRPVSCDFCPLSASPAASSCGDVAAVAHLASTFLRRALMVSRATIVEPIAACTGTSNICRGIRARRRRRVPAAILRAGAVNDGRHRHRPSRHDQHIQLYQITRAIFLRTRSRAKHSRVKPTLRPVEEIHHHFGHRQVIQKICTWRPW